MHQETHVINEHSFSKHILSSLGNEITDDMSSNVSVPQGIYIVIYVYND